MTTGHKIMQEQDNSKISVQQTIILMTVSQYLFADALTSDAGLGLMSGG